MRREKGIALVIVIMLSMVMMIVVGTILKLGQMHYHSSASQLKHTKAFYLAQAGVEWAIYRCRTNPSPNIDPYDINSTSAIEDPPGSGYYPPIVVKISDWQAGDPPGIQHHIDSKVDLDDVRLK